MSAASVLSRRGFLLLAGSVGGAVLGLRGQLWFASVWGEQETSLHSRLIALFKHQQSARVIGNAYLRQHPEEAALSLLLKNVIAATPADGFGRGFDADRLRTADEGELREAIERRVRQDFAGDSVVKVDGWILSVTEARLCALAAMA
jgi:hypothetical protein